ncbi:MAG: YndM family protein [Bacillales bacterium]|nr:YndM family protein [Bacillales bacterium]
MKYATILLIKFITCVIAFAVGLDLFFDATYLDIFSFSLLITVMSYLIGDRIILPHFGNTSASIVDFLLTYTSVWIFGSILLDNYMQIAWGSIISAVLITIAEVFIHQFILNRFPDAQPNRRTKISSSQKLAYNTEFSDDKDFHDKKE